MPRGKRTIPLPDEGKWKDAFKGYCLRQNFTLYLSKAMLQMLCATADDVYWDRALFPGISEPDNFITTMHSLVRRGLIRHTGQEDRKDPIREACLTGKIRSWALKPCLELTPAGKALVELLKVTGLFIEADMATVRKLALKKGG